MEECFEVVVRDRFGDVIERTKRKYLEDAMKLATQYATWYAREFHSHFEGAVTVTGSWSDPV